MKKQYFLLIGLLLACVGTYAQQNRIPLNEVPMKLAPLSAEELKYTTPSNSMKSAGDTLFYEDFGGGFATNGWTSVDTTQNGFDWIYTTAAPGGQYSTTIPALNSVTAGNGFASLPSDLYNTPTPTAGFSQMGSFLTSGPLAINPVANVLLRWRQSLRYCCNPSIERLELQVSTDSINWVAFDAKFGRSPSTFIANEDVEINISTVASNEDTIYLRFFQTASHYFWMIDDIAVIEGTANQLSVEEVYSAFGTLPNEGYYTMTPIALTQPLSFAALLRNVGGFTATNPYLKAAVNHSIYGNVWEDSSAIGSNIVSQDSDTFNIATAYPNTDGIGQYLATYFAIADSINEDTSRSMFTTPWAVTDTVFAKDFNVNSGNIGPASYVGGDNDGSRIGTKYTLNQAARVTSLSFFISTSTTNVGVEIKAQVWGFDTTQATLDDAINVPNIKAQHPLPYVIQAADLGSWLTISMLPPVTLPAGQYVVVAEQSGGNSNGSELYLGRDRDAEKLQPFGREFVSMVYTNDANPAWGNIFAQPMIRMNFGWLEGVEEAAKAIEVFTVSPNPNKGQFNVEVTAESANFDLSVRNMVGQVVYNEAITINNVLRKNIDLSNLNKGIYFVSIENGANRKVQKVVIK